MRSHLFTVALAAMSMPMLATAVPAHDIKHKSLQIVHPWAHESKDKTSPSADVYMTIRNSGRVADRLVSASSARSGQVQLVPVSADAFKIGAGQEIKLSKNTGFVRLLGLTKPLYMHDNFPVTLVFEKAGRIQVEVHIEEAAVAEPHKH
jgi:periplasmic copper chaperone A